MRNGSSENYFLLIFTKKVASLYVLSKSYIKADVHIIQSFLQISLLSHIAEYGGKYCRAVFDSPKNMAFKLMVQGSYWVALILHLLRCLWKWLFGVKSALSRVSSTKYNPAGDCAWNETYRWLNQTNVAKSNRITPSYLMDSFIYLLIKMGFMVLLTHCTHTVAFSTNRFVAMAISSCLKSGLCFWLTFRCREQLSKFLYLVKYLKLTTLAQCVHVHASAHSWCHHFLNFWIYHHSYCKLLLFRNCDTYF